MSGPRVVLITRRFWPLVGGAESAAARLATELRRQGAHPQILTARWERGWPREIEHAGVPVMRLPQPSLRFWGTMCYMRAIKQFLRDRIHEIDIVYVSMLKHDAFAALVALRNMRIPVILSARGSGDTGDFHWQRTANFGRIIRRRCLQADAFVACSRVIHDEFLRSGYPADRLIYIPNGVVVPPQRTPPRRLAARRSLSDIEPGLHLEPTAKLVVYTGRLHVGKGLFDLLDAWPQILAAHPAARLWMVGEGPLRHELMTAVHSRALNKSVFLPGAFDSVDEVLDAADVLVLPSYEEGMSNSLLEGMAAGLPVVATRIPGNLPLIEHERHGLLVAARDPQALATAICRVLSHSELAQRMGQFARDRVVNEFSIQQTARQHLDLFAKLIAQKRPKNHAQHVSN